MNDKIKQVRSILQCIIETRYIANFRPQSEKGNGKFPSFAGNPLGACGVCKVPQLVSLRGLRNLGCWRIEILHVSVFPFPWL